MRDCLCLQSLQCKRAKQTEWGQQPLLCAVSYPTASRGMLFIGTLVQYITIRYFWIGIIFNTQSQYNTVHISSDHPCPYSCLVLRYPCLHKEQCCAARFVFNAVVPDPDADSRRTSIDSEERLHYWELARTHYSPDVRAMVAQTVLPWHRIWQPRRYPCLAFKEGPCTT